MLKKWIMAAQSRKEKEFYSIVILPDFQVKDVHSGSDIISFSGARIKYKVSPNLSDQSFSTEYKLGNCANCLATNMLISFRKI